jgi:hypothetical protein
VREMVSHESLTYGEHEGSAYQGQFGDACYHPCGLLDQLGDVERCALRCCRSGGSQLPALGEMLDEVSRELRKPDRPSRPDGGRVAGGGASRRGYCGHCQLGSIIGYSLPHRGRQPSRGAGSSSNLIID